MMENFTQKLRGLQNGYLRSFSTLAMVIFVLSSCNKTPSISPGGHSTIPIFTTLQNSFTLSMFYQALVITGLSDSLKGSGPYTILAPDDAAFDSAGYHNQSDLAKINKDSLVHLLRYHIIYNQNVKLAAIAQKPDNVFNSWDGLPLYLSRPVPAAISMVNPDFLAVNGVPVIAPDVEASNGVIHVLKYLLKYPGTTLQAYLSNHPQFSFLKQGLQQFNLWGELSGSGPFTIFAPTDSAFIVQHITQDSVSKLLPSQFSSLLFGAYILRNTRIFTTDLFDFNLNPNPNSGAQYGNYVSPDLKYVVNLGLNVNDLSLPFNEQPVTVVAFGVDSLTQRNYLLTSIGSPVIDRKHSNVITGNGTLQQIDSLLVSPDSVKLYRTR